MKQRDKIGKVRITITISGMPEGETEFQEIIRCEDESDAVPTEAGQIQRDAEPALRRLTRTTAGPSGQCRVIKAKLDGPPPTSPAPTPAPKATKKRDPSGGTNGNGPAN